MWLFHVQMEGWHLCSGRSHKSRSVYQLPMLISVAVADKSGSCTSVLWLPQLMVTFMLFPPLNSQGRYVSTKHYSTDDLRHRLYFWSSMEIQPINPSNPTCVTLPAKKYRQVKVLDLLIPLRFVSIGIFHHLGEDNAGGSLLHTWAKHKTTTVVFTILTSTHLLTSA